VELGQVGGQPILAGQPVPLASCRPEPVETAAGPGGAGLRAEEVDAHDGLRFVGSTDQRGIWSDSVQVVPTTLVRRSR
jgi:hypothetical protein